MRGSHGGAALSTAMGWPAATVKRRNVGPEIEGTKNRGPAPTWYRFGSGEVGRKFNRGPLYRDPSLSLPLGWGFPHHGAHSKANSVRLGL